MRKVKVHRVEDDTARAEYDRLFGAAREGKS